MTKKTKSSTGGDGGGRNAEAGPWTGLIYWQENLVVESLTVVEVVAVILVVVESRSVQLTSPSSVAVVLQSEQRRHVQG